MPLMPNRQMPQGGMPPRGMPQGMPPAPQSAPGGGDAMSKMKDNMSIFNPTDATIMRESGQFRPDMTVRDFFAQQGVDVDGPVTQLLKFVQDQAQKANPLNKMKAMAGGAPQGQMPPAPQGMPQGAPQEGLGGLVKQMRG